MEEKSEEEHSEVISKRRGNNKSQAIKKIFGSSLAKSSNIHINSRQERTIQSDNNGKLQVNTEDDDIRKSSYVHSKSTEKGIKRRESKDMKNTVQDKKKAKYEDRITNLHKHDVLRNLEMHGDMQQSRSNITTTDMNTNQSITSIDDNEMAMEKKLEETCSNSSDDMIGNLAPVPTNESSDNDTVAQLEHVIVAKGKNTVKKLTTNGHIEWNESFLDDTHVEDGNTAAGKKRKVDCSISDRVSEEDVDDYNESPHCSKSDRESKLNEKTKQVETRVRCRNTVVIIPSDNESKSVENHSSLHTTEQISEDPEEGVFISTLGESIPNKTGHETLPVSLNVPDSPMPELLSSSNEETGHSTLGSISNNGREKLRVEKAITQRKNLVTSFQDDAQEFLCSQSRNGNSKTIDLGGEQQTCDVNNVHISDESSSNNLNLGFNLSTGHTLPSNSSKESERSFSNAEHWEIIAAYKRTLAEYDQQREGSTEAEEGRVPTRIMRTEANSSLSEMIRQTEAQGNNNPAPNNASRILEDGNNNICRRLQERNEEQASTSFSVPRAEARNTSLWHLNSAATATSSSLLPTAMASLNATNAQNQLDTASGVSITSAAEPMEEANEPPCVVNNVQPRVSPSGVRQLRLQSEISAPIQFNVNPNNLNHQDLELSSCERIPPTNVTGVESRRTQAVNGMIYANQPANQWQNLYNRQSISTATSQQLINSGFPLVSANQQNSLVQLVNMYPNINQQYQVIQAAQGPIPQHNYGNYSNRDIQQFIQTPYLPQAYNNPLFQANSLCTNQRPGMHQLTRDVNNFYQFPDRRPRYRYRTQTQVQVPQKQPPPYHGIHYKPTPAPVNMEQPYDQSLRYPQRITQHRPPFPQHPVQQRPSLTDYRVPFLPNQSVYQSRLSNQISPQQSGVRMLYQNSLLREIRQPVRKTKKPQHAGKGKNTRTSQLGLPSSQSRQLSNAQNDSLVRDQDRRNVLEDRTEGPRDHSESPPLPRQLNNADNDSLVRDQDRMNVLEDITAGPRHHSESPPLSRQLNNAQNDSLVRDQDRMNVLEDRTAGPRHHSESPPLPRQLNNAQNDSLVRDQDRMNVLEDRTAGPRHHSESPPLPLQLNNAQNDSLVRDQDRMNVLEDRTAGLRHHSESPPLPRQLNNAQNDSLVRDQDRMNVLEDRTAGQRHHSKSPPLPRQLNNAQNDCLVRDQDRMNVLEVRTAGPRHHSESPPLPRQLNNAQNDCLVRAQDRMNILEDRTAGPRHHSESPPLPRQLNNAQNDCLVRDQDRMNVLEDRTAGPRHHSESPPLPRQLNNAQNDSLVRDQDRMNVLEDRTTGPRDYNESPPLPRQLDNAENDSLVRVQDRMNVLEDRTAGPRDDSELPPLSRQLNNAPNDSLVRDQDRMNVLEDRTAGPRHHSESPPLPRQLDNAENDSLVIVQDRMNVLEDRTAGPRDHSEETTVGEQLISAPQLGEQTAHEKEANQSQSLLKRQSETSHKGLSSHEMMGNENHMTSQVSIQNPCANAHEQSVSQRNRNKSVPKAIRNKSVPKAIRIHDLCSSQLKNHTVVSHDKISASSVQMQRNTLGKQARIGASSFQEKPVNESEHLIEFQIGDTSIRKLGKQSEYLREAQSEKSVQKEQLQTVHQGTLLTQRSRNVNTISENPTNDGVNQTDHIVKFCNESAQHESPYNLRQIKGKTATHCNVICSKNNGCPDSVKSSISQTTQNVHKHHLNQGHVKNTGFQDGIAVLCIQKSQGNVREQPTVETTLQEGNSVVKPLNQSDPVIKYQKKLSSVAEVENASENVIKCHNKKSVVQESSRKVHHKSVTPHHAMILRSKRGKNLVDDFVYPVQKKTQCRPQFELPVHQKQGNPQDQKSKKCEAGLFQDAVRDIPELDNNVGAECMEPRTDQQKEPASTLEPIQKSQKEPLLEKSCIQRRPKRRQTTQDIEKLEKQLEISNYFHGNNNNAQQGCSSNIFLASLPSSQTGDPQTMCNSISQYYKGVSRHLMKNVHNQNTRTPLQTLSSAESGLLAQDGSQQLCPMQEQDVQNSNGSQISGNVICGSELLQLHPSTVELPSVNESPEGPNQSDAAIDEDIKPEIIEVFCSLHPSQTMSEDCRRAGPSVGMDNTGCEAQKKQGDQSIPMCVVCQKQATRICGSCLQVFYCSEECQITHLEQGHSQKCIQR